VLKKVGIVAAAATAAMIALSPLAFADNDDHDGETMNVYVEENGEERNQSNECEFSQDFDNLGTIDVGALVTQDQSGNCTNLGDDAEITEEAPALPILPPVL
jgi:hypothetical protein